MVWISERFRIISSLLLFDCVLYSESCSQRGHERINVVDGAWKFKVRGLRLSDGGELKAVATGEKKVKFSILGMGASGDDKSRIWIWALRCLFASTRASLFTERSGQYEAKSTQIIYFLLFSLKMSSFSWVGAQTICL